VLKGDAGISESLKMKYFGAGVCTTGANGHKPWYAASKIKELFTCFV